MTIFESERAYKLNYIEENIQFEIHLALFKGYSEWTEKNTHTHTHNVSHIHKFLNELK